MVAAKTYNFPLAPINVGYAVRTFNGVERYAQRTLQGWLDGISTPSVTFAAPIQRKIAFFILAFAAGLSVADAGSTPPAEKYSAPAYSAQHQHARVKVLTVGEGAQRAYAFIPDDPPPKKAPVVLFHHGWLGVSPKNFGALIDHLVRRGAVVIYPVYQEPPHTMPSAITELAATADRQALAEVAHLYPELMDLEKVMYYGYSMGAAISLNLASAPDKYGLPGPRALALMAPGNAHHVMHGPESASIIGDLAKIPADLPVVLVGGQADTAIGLPTARAWAAKLCHVQKDRRRLFIFPSDQSGKAQVKAGHGSPGAPDSRYDFPDSHGAVPGVIPARAGFEASASLNTLDFAGYWKIVGGLLDWLAFNRYPDEVFGDNAEATFLGGWPDGKPYKPAVIETPCR
ncbi:MAG: hypothetical protein EPN21_17030 [Methylococcaceae bacterium]|nr:MAG: hypothetical protein EPN21_17030 [Methylococcaceae bacterium]